MMATAWDVATSFYQEPPIYNFVTHKNNTSSYKQLLDQGWVASTKIPCLKATWYYCFELVDNRFLFQILHFFYHLLPAFFIDLLLMIMGYEFRLRRVYQKLITLTKIFEFFAFTVFEWKYDNVMVSIVLEQTRPAASVFLHVMIHSPYNSAFQLVPSNSFNFLQRLLQSLPPEDRKSFNFNMETLDFSKFLDQSVTGMRWFIMRESMDTVPAARIKQQRLKILHYCLTWTFKLFLVYIFVAAIQFMLKKVLKT